MEGHLLVVVWYVKFGVHKINIQFGELCNKLNIAKTYTLGLLLIGPLAAPNFDLVLLYCLAIILLVTIATFCARTCDLSTFTSILWSRTFIPSEANLDVKLQILTFSSDKLQIFLFLCWIPKLKNVVYIGRIIQCMILGSVSIFVKSLHLLKFVGLPRTRYTR